MSRARTIADFGDGIATADIGDGQVTAGKLNSTLDLTGKTVTLPAGVGGKVVGHGFVTNNSQVIRNAADYINLNSIAPTQGYTQMTLSYTPILSFGSSVLVVRSQSYTSEFNRNEEGGPTHVLWLNTTLMGVALHGKEFYSANSEGPASANKTIQGFYSSHTAGTGVTATVKLGNSHLGSTARYYTTNYSTANTDQYSQKCGTTSWIEILEIAL